MPVGVEPLPPLEVVLEEVEVVADVGLWVDGLVPRLLEEVVAGLGRLVDGLVPRLLEEVVVGLGRLVDGLVPRLLEEVVVGGRLTVIFPAGLLTDVLPFD